jgi:hypothetical protein
MNTWSKQKQALTRATNAQRRFGAAHNWLRSSELDARTLAVIRKAVQEWETLPEFAPGWPDEWHRWQNALNDIPAYRHMSLSALTLRDSTGAFQ